MSSFLLF